MNIFFYFGIFTVSFVLSTIVIACMDDNNMLARYFWSFIFSIGLLLMTYGVLG